MKDLSQIINESKTIIESDSEVVTRLKEKLTAIYHRHFPKSVIYFRGDVYSNGTVNRLAVIFTVFQKQDYSHGIEMNDPMRNICNFAWSSDGQKFLFDADGSFIYMCLPTSPYLAMSRRKVLVRKTQGDEARVIRAFEDGIKKLKADMVANKDQIYDPEKKISKYL